MLWLKYICCFTSPFFKSSLSLTCSSSVMTHYKQVYMGQYNNSCKIWNVYYSLSLLLKIVIQKKLNLKIQDIKKKVNGYSWKCQIWMVFFSCVDHIPSRLRTSLILLKDAITSLRGIIDVFYLLALIFNLNLLSNEYNCSLFYVFNKYHYYTRIYESVYTE